jgi:hypothetical protein
MDAARVASSCFPRSRYVGLLVCRWDSPSRDGQGRAEGRALHAEIVSAHAADAHHAYGNYSSEPADADNGAIGA